MKKNIKMRQKESLEQLFKSKATLKNDRRKRANLKYIDDENEVVVVVMKKKKLIKII